MQVVDEPVTRRRQPEGLGARAEGPRASSRRSFAFKAGDALYGTFDCRSVDTLLVFGSNGRVYSVPVALLPGGRGDGQPITTLIDLEAGHAAGALLRRRRRRRRCCSPAPAASACSRAVGDLLSRAARRQGLPQLEARREAAAAERVRRRRTTQVACLSLGGRLLVFALDELKLQANGGRGLTLIDLDAKDALVSVAAFEQALLRARHRPRGGKPKDEVLKGAALAAYVGKRARKGKTVAGLKAQRVLPAS